jgi:catechol 2,3-dioxygenase-like lactoylglutathione lyase family enzyme
MFQIEALDHVALHVQNLQQSLEWYQLVLGMETRYHYQDTTGHGKPVVLGSGDACIALFPPSPEALGVPFQGHIALRVTRANFQQAQAHLRKLGIDFEFVHYTRCDSMYFNDPTGYQIELSTYEME